MATLAELRAEAKRQKRKGYSKLKKADLVKLLETPPPKPPRGVPRKKPASQSVPVKQVQPAKEDSSTEKKGRVIKIDRKVSIPEELVDNSNFKFDFLDGLADRGTKKYQRLDAKYRKMSRAERFDFVNQNFYKLKTMDELKIIRNFGSKLVKTESKY